MLKIRLFKMGKKHQPSFRVVVVERRSKRDGEYLMQLGIYNPKVSPAVFKIDKKKYEAWVKKGAQPTETIKRLMKRHEKTA